MKSVLQSLSVKLLTALWLYIVCFDIVASSGQVEGNSLFYFSSCFTVSFFVPMAYLFVRSSYREKSISRGDIIHLAPFVTCLVCLLAINFTVNKSTAIHQVFYTAFDSAVAIIYVSLLLILLREEIGLLLKQKIMTVPENIPVEALQLANEGNKEEQQAVLTLQRTQASIQFTVDQILQMKTAVEEALTSGEPYLQQKFAITDLAEQTGIQLHQLSAFINGYYDMHYNDFINLHRVEYCKRKIIEEQEWRYLTLEAIAKESGFGNRNTFTNAFKKFNGATPAEFLKSIKIKSLPAA